MGIVKHDPVDQAELHEMLGMEVATESEYGVVKKATVQTAVTAATITAAPAGGTGATGGAYDTAANRDTAIAAINSLITEVAELTTVVNGILTKLKTAGVMSSS